MGYEVSARLSTKSVDRHPVSPGNDSFLSLGQLIKIFLADPGKEQSVDGRKDFEYVSFHDRKGFGGQ
jgi:hypothetical protein